MSHQDNVIFAGHMMKQQFKIQHHESCFPGKMGCPQEPLGLPYFELIWKRCHWLGIHQIRRRMKEVKIGFGVGLKKSVSNILISLQEIIFIFPHS